jgi:TetR/AcrR family transcriptional regulator, transcriptional repressor for nem operon
MSTSTRALAKQKTRELLIQAGMALFAQHGLDGPSLDAICERAGFTRGAFYVHFADRDDFLTAVMEQVGRQFLDTVIGSGLALTVERFMASVSSGLYPLTKLGGVRPYQLYDACARSPAIRARYVEIIGLAIDKLAVVLGAEQRRGVIARTVAAGDAAGLLLALAIGAHTLLDLEMPLDYAALARSALALLTAGAAPAPPRRRPRRG